MSLYYVYRGTQLQVTENDITCEIEVSIYIEIQDLGPILF